MPELKTMDNKSLIPKKLLLHEEDSKVLILNNDNKKVFYLDLEKGKVISELVLNLLIYININININNNNNKASRSSQFYRRYRS